MARPARQYRNIIEVWQYSPNTDSFGGSTQTSAKLYDVWARVETIPVNKSIDLGLDISQTAIRIYVRLRSDLDYNQDDLFIKYKSKTFKINRVTETDLDGLEFEIIATWQK
jgi:head-tail adaptor